MKTAILGTGFGKEHAKLFCQEKLVDEIIIWGRNPEKLKEIENEFGVKTTTDMDSIFNDVSIELVDVCLPAKLHAEYAVKALRAGKHVFVEMPLADTVENGRKIKDMANASTLITETASQKPGEPISSLSCHKAACNLKQHRILKYTLTTETRN